ncbi:MAG: ABC transporter ATP-binding protein/permease [Defluviitaleaceae bacterium]|nr:ABC transporter ATP-binding protein/permease [Defluviitaleaceae bacterium]
MLKKRKYTNIDILRIPFKVAPFNVVLQIILSLIQAILPTVLFAVGTAYFVDTAISIFNGQAYQSTIYIPLVVLLLLLFVESLIPNIQSFLNARTGLAINQKIIPAILQTRASLSYKYTESEKALELIERVTKKLPKTLQSGVNDIGNLLQSIVAITSVFVLVAVQVWWVIPIIVVFSVPLFWVAIIAGKKVYDSSRETYKYERRYSYYSETLTSRESLDERTVFGYVKDLLVRYNEQFKIAHKIQMKAMLKMYVTVKTSSILMVLIGLGFALTLINPLIDGSLTAGMFMGIITAVFGMLSTIGWSLQDASEGLSLSKELMVDLTKFVNLTYTQGANDLPDQTTIEFESLEFKNVTFKYPNCDKSVFENLSFIIEKGKHYAFIGVNGAGKTTIVKLLTGLYDEYEGEILLNNRELRTYPQSTLKALFSVVYQDFSRYEITLSDNVSLGNVAHNVKSSEIDRVINEVGLTDHVAKLKSGKDTYLGRLHKESQELSGGQWQKVAIARSLASKAQIKIFDEPTAALDPIAESQVYNDFKKLMKEKTTIFISHRLGSTRLADKIFVIDKGAIVEQGNTDELISQKGLYKQMFETQKRWYQ